MGSISGTTLEVTLIGAHGLKNKELFTKQDPYVVVQYGSQVYRTKTDKDGGTNPAFNSTISLRLQDGLYEFTAVIWNENVGRDDVIGSTRINFHSVLQTGLLDTWFPVYDKYQRQYGQLHVLLKYPMAHQRQQHPPPAPNPYPGYPAAPAAAPAPVHSAPPPAPPSSHPPAPASHKPPAAAYAVAGAAAGAAGAAYGQHHAPPPAAAPPPAPAYHPPAPAYPPAPTYPPPAAHGYPPPAPPSYPPQYGHYPPAPPAYPHYPPPPTVVYHGHGHGHHHHHHGYYRKRKSFFKGPKFFKRKGFFKWK